MTFQPPQPPEQPGIPQQPPPGAPAPGQYTPPPAPQYGTPPPAAPQYAAPPPAAPQPQWQATPPPAPGAGGYPAPSGGFDISKASPFDLGIIAAGVLAFLLSFFPYYTADLSAGFGGFVQSSSVSINAWHGFFGWAAALFALAGAVRIALEIFMPQLTLPVPAKLSALAAFGLSTLFVLLALLVIPGESDVSGYGLNIDTGHGFGYWASLIVIIAGVVLSVLQFLKSGGTLPGIGGKGGPTPPPPGYPQGGGYTPPSGGYGPPGQ